LHQQFKSTIINLFNCAFRRHDTDSYCKNSECFAGYGKNT
jgi:hypothetical protein